MLLKMNRDHHPSRAANIRGLGTGMLGSTAYAATQLRLIRSNVRGRTRAVVFNCKFIDRVCLPSQAYEAGRRFTIGQTRERGTARSRNAAVPLSLGSTARVAAGAFGFLTLIQAFDGIARPHFDTRTGEQSRLVTALRLRQRVQGD